MSKNLNLSKMIIYGSSLKFNFCKVNWFDNLKYVFPQSGNETLLCLKDDFHFHVKREMYAINVF